MQKRVLSRMVWHKTCTFCIHSKKIFSARRLTRHTVQEGTSLGPRIQRLDINHRMIILTLDNDPQMTGYVPWISVTRWGTETELSGFAMFSHGSHNAWLKCQGHSANWTLARQKWVAGYLLGYSLKFVWYIHVYTINIYSQYICNTTLAKWSGCFKMVHVKPYSLDGWRCFSHDSPTIVGG